MSQLSSQTAAVLRQNLTNLLAKREAAASESGRDASDIQLLAVSKKQPASASLIAQPFFEKKGWVAVKKEEHLIRGVMLIRHLMRLD